METCEYLEQAIDFLESTQSEMKIKFSKTEKHFGEEDDVRDIYKITLKRGQRSFSLDFGQSLIHSTHYEDTLNKNKFSLNGKGLNCNLKVIEKSYFSEFCKLKKGTPPNAYDVLASLVKYDPGTLENFCSNYGYSTDSKKAEKIYKAVVNEWKNICILWTDEEIEKLQEIN